jgi:hypothetical protein
MSFEMENTFNIVTWHLKAGIVKSEETSIARERIGIQFPAVTNTQTTIGKSVPKQRIGKHIKIWDVRNCVFSVVRAKRL